jgi:hypothetical protein
VAHAYTPGLRVTERAVLRRARRLPLPGTVLVDVGAVVTADVPVARTELPGNVQTVNVASLLGVHQSDIAECMQRKEGEAVEQGEILASTKSFFGLFRSRVPSPVRGSVESISSVTGQVLLREPPIPVEVTAYVDGTVVEVLPREGVVIETSGAFLQGIFGIGGETTGALRCVVENPRDALTEAALTPECRGKIVFGGSQVTGRALSRAVEFGVRGIVTGGVAITGSEEKGITLVVTEGFGRMTMAGKTYELLRSLEGRKCSMNGATQIRAGVMRPEVIVAQPAGAPVAVCPSAREGLSIGSAVRAIREPHFGRLGVVAELPPDLRVLETEAAVRVLRVRFDDNGETAVLPRANVEMIEG